MAWETPGRATANNQWWSYQHDEWRTGRYGVDTRPPGVIRRASWRGTRLSFVAPGDDWYDGRPAAYRVSAGRSTRVVQAAGQAGGRQLIDIPRRAARLVVEPMDEAGNVGPRLVLARPSSP